jgi:hypothetical protein
VNASRLRSLCVHGHFYQPPRENPFSGEVPREAGAEPFHDYNQRINEECYAPNAALGNFSRISFDLGPTLASWLQKHDRRTYRRILAQERQHYQLYGFSNALAQVHSHAIMPLCTEREKRIQVAWGLADFRYRFRHKAPGIWLAETAVDQATLRVLADFGVGFTILSPTQAAEPINPSEPYLARLQDGRTVTVFFYRGDLSGAVSFDSSATTNADRFVQEQLMQRRDGGPGRGRLGRGLSIIATDGELYGHHQPLRQYFLSHLLRISAPLNGFEVTTLARHLAQNPPRREVRLVEPSAWSCSHGVDRWAKGCPCTEGAHVWKARLRAALRWLADEVDASYDEEAAGLFADARRAEEDYVRLRLGATSPETFWRRHGRAGASADDAERGLERGQELLEGQYYRHLMFASCAFYFEDLDRLEPRKAIANGLRAIEAVRAERRPALREGFEARLAEAESWRSGLTGADLLREVEPSRDASLAGAA